MGKGEVTRQAILERATALASRCGLEGVSIGHLAEDLGLSKSGLFAHFGAKETLQVEILRFAADRFVQAVVRPALAAPRGEPRVRAIFERWLGWRCGCRRNGWTASPSASGPESARATSGPTPIPSSSRTTCTR